MKKIIIPVLAVVMALLFAGCIKVTLPPTASTTSAEPQASVQPTVTTAAETTTSPEAPVSQEGMFTLKDGSMSIKTPDGWTASDMSSGAIPLGVLVSADQKSSIAIVSTKLPAALEGSALDQAYSASAASSVPGGTILSQKDITISGVSGKLFEITGKTNGQDTHTLLVVLIKGDKLYTAAGMSLETEYETYKDIIISSFNTMVMK